ncbi:RidA family protein [Streptomyces sp. 3MP-14]|uniref:RidA family protein n=1 Tax=Streptomyces mimosae TaxID=2586635 RepID=A0A5N6AKW7_9ACTN|nr:MULTISPECIES: Rid family hydrolase [Streptomyces]KAB8168696.1 RidA family protein [Streptomyces mimosae]KAB8178024.1 RidA family protein [Streptomyces sp. 3MP-14]
MSGPTEVRRVGGEGEWERTVGAATAVAAGPLVLVGGTLPPTAGAAALGDPYEQTRSALADAVAALEPFGLGVADVVRTRLYLAHARDGEDATRAHREVFGEVRPVCTVLVVGFPDSRVLVQVELEAFAGTRGGGS